jgi:hypothetical protein
VYGECTYIGCMVWAEELSRVSEGATPSCGRRDPGLFVTSGAAAGGTVSNSQISPPNLQTFCWEDTEEGLTEIIGLVGALVYAMLFELRL